MSFVRIDDPTNVHNDWQGTIRAAPLDLSVLAGAVAHDLGRGQGVEVRASLAITCLDQIEWDATVYVEGAARQVHREDLPEAVSKAVGLPVSLASYGPTRAAVHKN